MKMGKEEQTCKILQLSDCNMMYILSYLDATSLFNLSRTCQYFKNIVEDPKLWRYIDARHEPNSTKKVQYVFDRVHDKTSHILMRAESKYNGLVPHDVLIGWNRLEHLTILALENQRFDGRSLCLQDFPKSLEELSLKKTYVKNGKLFFQSSFHTMRNLRVLILDECDWIDSNFFMSVAKYENLEILSIIKCMRLHLNVIPYLNVARHGCKKLKVIDCRLNTVANEILVHSHKPLLAMYFQSMTSYQLDNGRPLIKFPSMTIEYQELLSQSIIKDRSLEQFKYLIGDVVEELPYSFLYQDPYPECSCGWKNRTDEEPGGALNREDESKSETRTIPIDDYIDFNLSPQRFICKRHMKELNKLPKDLKNFFYENQKKFCPDSSDNDSDSDDDRDCCMFGVGKSQQMIVLKVREADDRGHLPEPEVIDIFIPERNVNNTNPNEARPEQIQRNMEPDPQPSTSRESDSSESTRNTAKRKAQGGFGGTEAKMAKMEVATGNQLTLQLDTNSNSSNVPREDGPSKTSQNTEHSPKADIDTSRMEPNLDNNISQANDRPGPSHQSNIEEVARAGPSRADRMPTASVRENINWRYHRRRLGPMWEQEGQMKECRDKIKLRRLSLRGYREITDEALGCIRNLGLDLLDLTHTAATKRGIEQFLTLNPNCRILHPNYCVCKPRIPC